MLRGQKGQRRHAWAQTLLSRHGSMLIIAGRYLAGARSVTMLTAGMLRYPTRRFLLTNTAAASFWAIYAALIGYLGGAAFKDNPVNGMLLDSGVGLVLAALIEDARRIAARRHQPTSTPRCRAQHPFRHGRINRAGPPDGAGSHSDRDHHPWSGRTTHAPTISARRASSPAPP